MSRTKLFTLLVVAIALIAGGCGCAAPTPTRAPRAAEAQKYLDLARRTGSTFGTCSYVNVYRADPGTSSIVYGNGISPDCGGDGAMTLVTVTNGRVVQSLDYVEGWSGNDAFYARLKQLPKRVLRIIPTSRGRVSSSYWVG